MSSKSITLNVLGHTLRLNAEEQHHAALRNSVQQLEQRISEMKERSGIIQLEKVLAIVALNLTYELNQEQQKTSQNDNLLQLRIQQLDHSLGNILSQKNLPSTMN